MKELLTKKFIVIVTVITAIVATAIILTVTTGNMHYPQLSDPNGVFYQRYDDDGNVVYTITNQELYEQIKTNDGTNQLMYMVDSILLADYLDSVTQAQIDEKIDTLTYGTSDPTAIADLDAATKTDLEDTFTQSLILSGFEGMANEYAKMLVARDLYALDFADEEGLVSERDVVLEYLNNYWEDISAIKIRFTSEADAENVMRHFNLLALSGEGLRSYNGYIFEDEKLLDNDSAIVEAYIPVEAYYVDASDDDIYDAEGNKIYYFGTHGYYTPVADDDYQYRIDGTTGNLVDGTDQVIIAAEQLFDTYTEANNYVKANTVYYSVNRTDPFDMTETINVLDSSQNIVYTIDQDGVIRDAANNDVTYTTDLVVNKVYTEIDNVETVTDNNSSALTDAELLQKYILMYNYVYGVYRDTLSEGSTAAELIALNDDNLSFAYNDVADVSANLATYMFKTLNIADDSASSEAPKSLGNYYYLVYKLSEGTKQDITSEIFDYVVPTIIIPTTIGASIDLPTDTYYDGTIAWSSENTDIITDAGVVTSPDTDTQVDLDYTITILGEEYEGTITVTVLANGDTVDVTESDWEEIALKDLFDDQDLYDQLYTQLIDDYVYGDSADSNVSDALVTLRSDMGLKIYDRFVAMDYQDTDDNFTLDPKGDKTVFASLDSTLTSDQAVEITADQFYEYAVARNASLYLLYAAQYKELIYTTFFENLYGDQRDLRKNKSDKMDEMYASISSAKQYYVYIQNYYSTYGIQYPYSTFSDYAYSQYGTKTELDLLEYFVAGSIQPYLIDEVINQYDIVDMLYNNVQEYYDNYFSLFVTHLLIYVDFDEDGAPDDYNDYKDAMTTVESDNYAQLQAALETAIDEYLADGNTFDDLVAEYNDAARDDSTWGIYKQNGLFLLTESLNQTDDNDNEVSLTYSGDYGVKDTYVPEFVQALVNLYNLYQNPVNIDKSEMYSDFFPTEFGIHEVLATPGDDFSKPTAYFEEEDAADPQYTAGLENSGDAPTLDQMQVYALYTFYSQVYDLGNADIETQYNITVPVIPTSVSNALDVYFGDLLQSFYVRGTINIDVVGRLLDGEFISTQYSDLTDSDLMANLGKIGDVYYEAVVGQYE